jgi:phenylalanyl-tRNA synthetase alpha chain
VVNFFPFVAKNEGSSMQNEINEIQHQFSEDLNQVQSTDDLETIKVKYLGKKGSVQSLMKTLKDVSAEDRPHVGKYINDLKEHISGECDQKQSDLIQKEETAQLSQEVLDITLPGRRQHAGSKHLLTHVMDEVIDILIGMGFSVQSGPDIETDYYNFEALNFSSDHPARDMQDTFYISDNVVLRTHTTNIQARIMETQKPPIRIIAPGKVYRNETVTARSHVFFHQVDAFYVDEGVTFTDLLSAMDEFLCKLFRQQVETRFRPSYFPFVEPGMEVDVRCLVCEGQGCPVCKHSGWLEVAGAGMIHPEVLRNGGIDPEVYTGYAWGMGLDRLVMVRHGIRDIRLFTENDLRFLHQFSSL